MRPFFRLPALAVLAGAAMFASAAGGAQRTAIHFADIGNIRSWHSDSPNELYVESLSRQWYRITFWSPCHSLPFAIGVAFVTDSIGDLDKYSSILVDGERCWFRTFEESAAPAGVRSTPGEESGT